MSAGGAVLAHHDFLRVPVLAGARPDGFKEWHHYLVQSPELRLLVNFSVTSTAAGRPGPTAAGRPGPTAAGRPGPTAARLVPRVTVMAHTRRWAGVVEQFNERDLDVSADVCGMAVGANRMLVDAEGYQVVLDLPDRGIAGVLRFTPVGAAAVTRVNNQPVGAGRINWLFVPRLRADGWFVIDGEHHVVERCPAYHDHNWGHFRWGDDFGWEWGSILPTAHDDPWSLVFTRKTDRRRLRCLSQALYLWRHGELVAMFRDAAVGVRSTGLLGSGPDCTLPPVMTLLSGGAAADVPASMEITGASSAGSVRAVFRPQSHARLVQPSELALDQTVVLSEIGGPAHLDGTVGGRSFAASGNGVFEMLHG